MTLGFGNQYSIQLSYGRILKDVEGAHSTPECSLRDSMKTSLDLYSVMTGKKERCKPTNPPQAAESPNRRLLGNYSILK